MQKPASKITRLKGPAFICALGLIIYSNTFYGPFHFDDFLYIVKNAGIKNLTRIDLIWDFVPTRFITNISFALNYRLHRIDVFGYHFFNFIAHLSTAVLVWWLARITFATPVMKRDAVVAYSDWIAFFAAALFVAHPVQTQAVAYIVQRAAGLAALFYLLSLCLYAKSRVLGMNGPAGAWSGNLYYAASLISALAGAFTKETMITLPLAILLYEFCFLKTGARPDWKRAAPFFAVSLIIPLALFFNHTENSREMLRIVKSAQDIPRWEYILTQPRVLITYLRLLFIPLNQNFDYDYPLARTFFEPAVLASLFTLAAVLFVSMRIFKRYRLLSFAAFWFFLALMPESSVISLSDVIFEHRLYLPMAGFAIFLASAPYYLLKKKSAYATAVLFAVLGCFAVLAYARNAVWESEIRLWQDTVRKSPAKARCWDSLGNAYAQKGLYAQAQDCFLRAIAISPLYGNAYYNLGALHYNMGEFNQAIAYLDQAISLSPADAEAHYYKALSFHGNGDSAGAVSGLLRAIVINPGYLEAYKALADIYEHSGRQEEAKNLYRKAIAARPDLAELYVGLAILYGNSGDNHTAIGLLQKAIKINPRLDEAYANLGSAYGMSGKLKEALFYCKQALRLNPAFGAANMNLAAVHYGMGQYSLAIEYCDKAQKLGCKVPANFLEALKPYRK